MRFKYFGALGNAPYRFSLNPKLTPLVSQISWTNNLIILSGNKSDEEK